MKKTEQKTYWHFVSDDRCLGYGDGRFVESGKTYSVLDESRPVKLCSYGMHASKRVIDALKYAPGVWLCKVTLDGDIQHDSDKSVAQSRTVLRMANVEELLREFARTEALRVFSKYFSKDDEKVKIVFLWLEEGKEDHRSAAWSSARSAAWSDAGSAARSAAWSAAESDAWLAVRSDQNKRLLRLINKKANWI